MFPRNKPKGLCPDCKVMVVLSADGTIRHHDRKVLNPHPTPQGLPADHGFAYHLLAKCPGGRKAPVPPPWNPECWHPPKALDPEPDLWLLGEIPLWYESTLKARYPPKEPKGEVIWRPAPYIARPFDPGHDNLIQTAAKELCPDGATEKESDPERSSHPEKTAVTAPKYCDPEE